MADISALSGLQSTEPLDLPKYQSASPARPFPAAGRYMARTPESFGSEAFTASSTGNLLVDVSPTIVGGEHDGYKITFTKVSAKTWTDQKSGKATSQLGRYLKACGLNEEIPGDPQAQANAAERTANTLVQIDVDWYAQNRDAGFRVKGMKSFPLNPDGTYNRNIPVTKSDGTPYLDPITGEQATARAFLEVTRFMEVSN